jgi:hypothetical protein
MNVEAAMAWVVSRPDQDGGLRFQVRFRDPNDRTAPGDSGRATRS